MSGATNEARPTPLAAIPARLDNVEKRLRHSVNAVASEGRGAFEAYREKWQATAFSSRLKEMAFLGETRVADLVQKAEGAGADALGRAARFQNAAVSALGFATRDQVEDLAREVKRLVKKAQRLPRQG